MFRYRDWKCPKCGATSHDVPIDVQDQWCPWCGEQMIIKWSAPATLFKGTGWTEKFY